MSGKQPVLIISYESFNNVLMLAGAFLNLDTSLYAVSKNYVQLSRR